MEISTTYHFHQVWVCNYCSTLEVELAVAETLYIAQCARGRYHLREIGRIRQIPENPDFVSAAARCFMLEL